MAQLNVILFNILLIFSISSLHSQCDSIVLKNQQDVNQFISKYGKCKEVEHLIIRDVDADITQLDSLYTIEQINGELRLNFRNTNENIKNIDGLKNLKFAGAVYGNSYKVEGQFSKLDSVIELGFNGRLSEFTNEYFSYFPKLRNIEKRLFITNPASENSTPQFNTGSFFELHISSGIDSSTLKLLSNRIKKENLKTLIIFPSDGIDLRNLTILDSLENLQLGYCKNSNFAQISTIKNLKTLMLENDLGNNDYVDGLQNVEFLRTLWLSNNKSKLDYRKILPSLNSIDERLFISNQDSLTNLRFFDDLVPPQDSSLHFTILISDNKRLNDCNTSFLCEALARYPESVIIRNNGAKCTKEEIIKYCKTVNTLEIEKLKLVISPNPTNGNLKIDNLKSPAKVTITNINGQIVKQFNNVQDEVIVLDLPQGIYILDIRSKETNERHKIVKVE
jgi:hypothetical protein